MWFSHANSDWQSSQKLILKKLHLVLKRASGGATMLLQVVVNRENGFIREAPSSVWSNHDRSLAGWTTYRMYKHFSTQIKVMDVNNPVRFPSRFSCQTNCNLSPCFDSLCAEVQICQPNDLHAAQDGPVKRGHLPPAWVPYVYLIARNKHRFFQQEGPSLNNTAQVAVRL